MLSFGGTLLRRLALVQFEFAVRGRLVTFSTVNTSEKLAALALSATLCMTVGCQGAADHTVEISELKTKVASLERDSSKNGRYLIVNGMPSMARYLMLLDTKTGRTWVICTGKDSVSLTNEHWCAVNPMGESVAP